MEPIGRRSPFGKFPNAPVHNPEEEARNAAERGAAAGERKQPENQ